MKNQYPRPHIQRTLHWASERHSLNVYVVTINSLASSMDLIWFDDSAQNESGMVTVLGDMRQLGHLLIIYIIELVINLSNNGGMPQTDCFHDHPWGQLLRDSIFNVFKLFIPSRTTLKQLNLWSLAWSVIGMSLSYLEN